MSLRRDAVRAVLALALAGAGAVLVVRYAGREERSERVQAVGTDGSRLAVAPTTLPPADVGGRGFAPPAPPAPVDPGAAAAEAASEPNASLAPPRIPSRRHRGGQARHELGGAAGEMLAAQLRTGLRSAQASIEECLRVPAPGATPSDHGTADVPALIEALATKGGLAEGTLTNDGEKMLRELEATGARSSVARGTLVLDVEPLEGSVRIVDVPPGRNGSTDEALVTCARRALRGKVVPVPGARTGARIPVTVALGPAEEHGR